jgi:hypothetical protein
MSASMEFEFDEKPENGSGKMNEEPRTSNLVDTTDCLEAVGVIRCWKNILFIIIMLALLLLQGLFWVANIRGIGTDEPAVAVSADSSTTGAGEVAVAIPDKIKKAAKEVAPENVPASSQSMPVAEPNEPEQVKIRFSFEPKVKHITAVIQFLNFVLIPASILYCLTMLFSFKVSLIGRLGGINHVARAFFLSLLFVVLLMPWQLLFSPVFAGAMWTPVELIAACEVQKTMWANIFFYLRFTGYWLLVLLLLLFAQLRSMRWARATLRRLEVV